MEQQNVVVAAEIDDCYMVQKILDHEENDKGDIVKYKVRWRGYTSDEDSWVISEDMSCPDKIKKYTDKLASKKGLKVDGKFHTWQTVLPGDEEDDPDEEPPVDTSGTILDAVRQRAKSRSKNASSSTAAKTANVSFTLLYEAEKESSDEDDNETKKDNVSLITAEKYAPKKTLKEKRTGDENSDDAKVGSTQSRRKKAKSQECTKRKRSGRSHYAMNRRRSENGRFSTQRQKRKRADRRKFRRTNGGHTNKKRKVDNETGDPEKEAFPAPTHCLDPAEPLPSIDTFSITNSSKISLEEFFEGVSPSLSSNEVVFVNIGSEECSPRNYSRPNSISSSTTFQNLEVISKTSPNNFCDQRRDNIENFVQNVKRIYQTINRQLEYHTSPKVWPITHQTTDDEKNFLQFKLHQIVVDRDLAGLKLMLSRYRAYDLDLNRLYENQTLLMMCCYVECNDNHLPCTLIEDLIVSGTAVNSSPASGVNALMISAANGFVCQMKTLLRLCARTDVTNFDYETPLFMAIRNCPDAKLPSTISLLLGQGTNIRCVNRNNQTIFDVAYSLQRWSAVEILKEHIKKSESNFMNLILKDLPRHVISRFLIEFRFFEIVANTEWKSTLYATKSDFPDGYSIVLFLSGVEFAENGAQKYYSVVNERFVEIYFNGNNLKSNITGTVDVITLKPWVYGENLLIVRNIMLKGVLKLAIQANRVENVCYV